MMALAVLAPRSLAVAATGPVASRVAQALRAGAVFTEPNFLVGSTLAEARLAARLKLLRGVEVTDGGVFGSAILFSASRRRKRGEATTVGMTEGQPDSTKAD